MGNTNNKYDCLPPSYEESVSNLPSYEEIFKKKQVKINPNHINSEKNVRVKINSEKIIS